MPDTDDEQMVALSDHYIPLQDGELATLIRKLPPGTPIDTAFGPSGVALKWSRGQKLPASVKMIGLMRGVLNENTSGAGI